MSVRDTYVREVRDKIRDLDRQIEEMAQRIDEVSAEAKQEYQQRLGDLRAQREKANDKLEELQKAGSDVWADLRSGTDEAMDALADAVDKARCGSEWANRSAAEPSR